VQQPQMQPSQMNFTPEQLMNLHPPQPDRVAQQPVRYADNNNASPMMGVPPLSVSQEPTSRQVQPTFAQTNPAIPNYSQFRLEEQFQPSSPLPDSLFLSPPQATGQQTLVPERQSVQSYNHQAYYPQQGAMNVAMSQPCNVPYGQNTAYTAQQQRVRIPAISGGRSNQVQTGRETINSFSGTSSTFVDPFETQLATAPHSQRYYDAAPQPMSGNFQMWQTDRPQGIR